MSEHRLRLNHGFPLLLLLLVATTQLQSVAAVPAIRFRAENAKPASNIKALNFKSRFTLPYGPDLYQRDPPQSPDDQPYAGYGVGMGAAEMIAYDYVEHYLYSMSDVGFVIVVDYKDADHPKLTEWSFPLPDNKLGGMEICPEQGRLFVTLSGQGKTAMYELGDRETQRKPKLLKVLETGPESKNILPNKDCSLIVITNVNEGEDLNQGSISIMTDIESDSPKRTTLSLDFDEWDDEYLLRRGLNMPLTKKALEYWDDYSHLADQLDFSHVRENYRSAIFLEPERLAWNSEDETELLVSMKDNSGLIRINMTDLSPVAVAGYGLKDFSVVPVDVNENDGTCDLRTYDSLFAMRNPDTIQTVHYNDKFYVVTANEDAGKEYGDWEEKLEAGDIFKGSEFALKDVFPLPRIFDPKNSSLGHSAIFNSECQGEGCVPSAEISLGSNAVDYETDPRNPIFYRMVLLGGRGWSIYELPENPEDLLKLVFDSGDAIEKDGCANFPWSHNSKQDGDNSPVTGANNTLFKSSDEDDRQDLIEMNDPEQDGCLDQGDGTPGACPLSGSVDESSASYGPAVENIVVGVACGRLIAAMATEKSSIAMVFDMTDITNPEMLKVFHLTPISEFKSMGLAYNAGELGDVDPESSVFVRADQSPSGRPGIMFGGAHSGTVSWWEFECDDYEESTFEDGETTSSASSHDSGIWALLGTTFAASLVLWIMQAKY